MIHTGSERLTDIDMVGPIDPRDRVSLAGLGFVRDGRHWVFGWAMRRSPSRCRPRSC